MLSFLYLFIINNHPLIEQRKQAISPSASAGTMASRPRRSAATKANKVISVHARWANSPERSDRSIMSSRRSGRASGVSVSRDPPSSPGDSHLSLTVKVPSNKLRQATRGESRRSEQFEGGEIVQGKRNRGGKKSYVVDSSPDDDEEEEEEAEIDDDDDDDDMDEEDAEGEDEMEVDAEGEDVDAEGDIDMDMTPIAPTIKVSRPPRAKLPPRAAAAKIIPDDDEDDDDEDEDDDDDDLSDPADSDDDADQTLGFGDDTMVDEDAEGEEIEVAGEEADEDEDEEEEGVAIAGPGAGKVEVDSDEEGSQDGELDLTKMTKRQRARFEDEPQQYMKLSDGTSCTRRFEQGTHILTPGLEVQVKKHFTAEELSMRRQEMARRRRNLSDKRNEEVKVRVVLEACPLKTIIGTDRQQMETINKLLKKQAPKINRKAAAAAANGEFLEDEASRPSAIFVRWVSSKDGVRVAVPKEMLEGPAGKVFGGPRGRTSGRMVEEVA